MYYQVNMASYSSRVWVVTAALIALLAAGCTQNAVRSKTSGSAPALSGEGQAHIRGVSDPNAPFTLIDRTKTAAGTAATGGEGDSAAAPCQAADLQVYEAAASMNGQTRTVRLALKNIGANSCRLNGYPAIELEDENGAAIANIAVRQTGAASLSGAVVAPVVKTSSGTAASSAVDIVLRAGSQASFEIGWSSGEGCPLVSRFTVALPETPASGEESAAPSGSFTINRALNVCNGEMQVTALRAGGAV